jgi:hypothetical protein
MTDTFANGPSAPGGATPNATQQAGDVTGTLAELERKLRELEHELTSIGRRRELSGAPAAPDTTAGSSQQTSGMLVDEAIEPPSPAGPAGAVAPATQTEPAGATTQTEPATPATPVEPAGAGRPIEPAETGQSVEPAEAGRPIEPAGTGQPVEPAEAGQPVKFMRPLESARSPASRAGQSEPRMESDPRGENEPQTPPTRPTSAQPTPMQPERLPSEHPQPAPTRLEPPRPAPPQPERLPSEHSQPAPARTAPTRSEPTQPAPTQPAPTQPALAQSERPRPSDAQLASLAELRRFRDRLERFARDLAAEYDALLGRVMTGLTSASTPAVAPSDTPSDPTPGAHNQPATASAAPAASFPASPEEALFEGHVELGVGPFYDIVSLSAFESRLASLPYVVEASVRRFEASHAVVDVRLSAPLALVRELRRTTDTDFSVREVADGRILLTFDEA